MCYVTRFYFYLLFLWALITHGSNLDSISVHYRPGRSAGDTPLKKNHKIWKRRKIPWLLGFDNKCEIHVTLVMLLKMSHHKIYVKFFIIFEIVHESFESIHLTTHLWINKEKKHIIKSLRHYKLYTLNISIYDNKCALKKLGKTMTEDGACDMEVTKRIEMETCTFNININSFPNNHLRHWNWCKLNVTWFKHYNTEF